MKDTHHFREVDKEVVVVVVEAEVEVEQKEDMEAVLMICLDMKHHLK